MLFCLDIDDDDQSEKRRNLDIIYKFMNAACIATLFCSCTLESENEKEVDNEKDIYFGNPVGNGRRFFRAPTIFTLFSPRLDPLGTQKLAKM